MSGGVVRAASIRSVQRATSRSCAPVSRAWRTGETSRSASASAASVSDLRPLGAGPREGHDPVPRVGRAMDRQPAAAFAVVGPEAADPGDGRGDGIGPVAGRHVGAELDERVAAGIALAVPGPAPADGDLELDHRLEPVDVRALEQAGLDQTHGPGRIARCQRLDWPDDRRVRAAGGPVHRRARRPAGRDRRRPAGIPRRPRAPGQHRLRQLHAGRRRRGRALGGGVPRPSWAPRSSAGPTRPDASATTVVATFHGPAGRAAGAADRPHGHGLRPGHRAPPGRSGSTTASPTARA